MQVTLLAWTSVAPGVYQKIVKPGGDSSTGADKLAEFAGRACYESWDCPNPATAKNDAYLANILRQEHFSVLEHASATFYLENVPRSLTHELVRHRHLSFSQRSQRYVDESRSGWWYPDAVQEALGAVDQRELRAMTRDEIDRVMMTAQHAYEGIMLRLTDAGVTGKKAREAARSVLPNCTHTSIVVTGNHRAWRDMLQKRWHVAADSDMRKLAGMILRQLKGIAPSTYADIDENSPGGALPRVQITLTNPSV